MNVLIRNLLVVLLLAALMPAPAIADELIWEVRTGAGRSDNIARTETGELDETIGIAGLALDYEYTSRGFEVDINGDVEYRRYIDETFDDDSYGAANVDLQFNLVQNVFSWRIENRFGHTRPNPFRPETPTNRERTNSFATGPEILLPLGSSTGLGLSSRWSRNTFSRTDADNDSLRGILYLTRALSRNRSLSLNASVTDVQFDNTDLNRDFDIRVAYFGFASENSRGTINISLGYNELDDGIAEVQDGNYIDFALSRQISDRSRFDLNYSERLTYASDAFRNRQNLGFTSGETQGVAGIADPLEIRSGRVGINYEREITSFRFSVSALDEDFVSANGLDRETLEARIGGDRQFGRTWEGGVGVAFRRTDFDVGDRRDDDLIYSLDLSYRFTQVFRVALELTRVDRDSNIVGQNFVENVGFLTFRFGQR
ncbi:MAG: outer membrane beta-barrel protein [Woeseiaceae bacterium]|nr:outer membrane beta-barrel protein [Woeseiaceae bacterium]